MRTVAINEQVALISDCSARFILIALVCSYKRLTFQMQIVHIKNKIATSIPVPSVCGSNSKSFHVFIRINHIESYFMWVLVNDRQVTAQNHLLRLSVCRIDLKVFSPTQIQHRSLNTKINKQNVHCKDKKVFKPFSANQRKYRSNFDEIFCECYLKAQKHFAKDSL